MAHQDQGTSVDVQVMEFVLNLPKEEQSKYDLETDEGFAAAHAAYFASLAGEENGSRERKEREARNYTVLLMEKIDSSSATVEVIGSGLGSIGREASDPLKWSEARKLRGKAERKAVLLRRQGKDVRVLVLPTEDLGNFFA